MRRLNKKGVSPIIAVLLLIVIAVAAALLTYLWVLGYIGSAQRSGQPTQLEEKIKIDGVKVETGATITIYVYVRNIGSKPVKVTDIYILNATTGAVIDHHEISGGQTISPGEIAEISFTASGSYTSRYTYVAKAVTSKGTEASLAFTWP